MDRPHVPPPYMDRSFTGAQVMLSRKSAEEAPTVSEYDYANVGTFQMMEGMTTDFDLLGRNQLTTSMYGHVGKEKPTYDPTVLLNDAWFCILTDDGGKLYTILNMMKNDMGIERPASYPYETMFGKTTLIEKIRDAEFKIPHGKRQDALALLARFN